MMHDSWLCATNIESVISTRHSQSSIHKCRHTVHFYCLKLAKQDCLRILEAMPLFEILHLEDILTGELHILINATIYKKKKTN